MLHDSNWGASHYLDRMRKSDLTADYVRLLLSYDPLTGEFRWKERPRNVCVSNRAWHTWNTQRAGKLAGYRNSDGYIRIKLNGSNYSAQRLAWLYETGEWPTDEVDHRDRNRARNEWENFRIATRSQNRMNCAPPITNTSGVKGVHFNKRKRRWRAQIVLKGKLIFLGDYSTFEGAVQARKEAEERLFGEFAYVA